MSNPQKRLHTLLTDRSVTGLEPRGQEELQYLLAGATLDPSYERAAAALELALHDHGEQLPEYIEDAVLVQAGRYHGFTEVRANEPTIGTPTLPQAQLIAAQGDGEGDDSPLLREWEVSPGVDEAIESGVLESSLTDGRIDARGGPAESQQAPILSDLEPKGRAGKRGRKSPQSKRSKSKRSRSRRSKSRPRDAFGELDAFDDFDEIDEIDDLDGDLDRDPARDRPGFDPTEVSQSALGATADLSDIRSTSLSESSIARWATYVSAIAALVMLSIALWLFAHRDDGPDPADLRAQVEEADDMIEWQFATKPDPAVAEGASGSVVWSSELQAGVLILDGLGVNEASELQYQLWIVDKRREGPPVDGGVFDVEASGTVEIPIEAKLIVGEPAAFVITVERPGGVVVSGQERVAMVAAAG